VPDAPAAPDALEAADPPAVPDAPDAADALGAADALEPGDGLGPDAQASAPDPAPAVKPPEGARLVALNMALSGKPRDETARYLRENFDVADADALLDEVYAKAGS
jgi:hypothetical protein